MESAEGSGPLGDRDKPVHLFEKHPTASQRLAMRPARNPFSCREVQMRGAIPFMKAAVWWY